MIILKYTTVLCALLVAVTMSSCATVKSPSIVTDANASMKEEVKEPADVEAVQIVASGNFQSVSGAMDELSCYCSNGGYVVSSAGKKVALCFKEGENPKNCTVIEAKGRYKTTQIDSEPSSPCAGGSMTYLEVESFTCK